jgi:hypothetical protein
VDGNEELDALGRDVRARWEAVTDCERIIAEARTRVVKTVYAKKLLSVLYDLRNYAPDSFEPGGPVSTIPVQPIDAFGLDEFGCPVYHYLQHYLQSAYIYGPDEVIRLSVKTHNTTVPSGYFRVALRDGHAVTYQSMSYQTLPEAKTRAETLMRLAERQARMRDAGLSDRLYDLIVETYSVVDGVRRSASVYTESGQFKELAQLTYEYSDDGVLQRTVKHVQGARDAVVYLRTANRPIKELSEKLSRRIAERTVEYLQGQTFDGPLVSVEIVYHTGAVYLPGIGPRTRPYSAEDPVFPDVGPDDYATLPQEDFEPDISDFTLQVHQSMKYDAGKKMMREAARQLGALAREKLPTTDEFVAFAIDWEMEGDILAKVLVDCGARADLVKAWKKRRWLG